MLINHSATSYLVVRGGLGFLTLIAPLSILYVVIVFILVPANHQPSKYISVIPVLETLFYLLVFLPRTYYLQLPAKHPALFKEERRHLYTKCLRLVKDPDQFISKWFCGAPLSEVKVENFKQFYRWAFLNSADVIDEETEQEVTEALAEAEFELGRTLEPGLGSAKCLRLTIDKIEMAHRPLFYYLVVALTQDIGVYLFLRYLGFQFYRSSISNSLKQMPPRPQALITKTKSPSSTLSYFYTPHTSTTRPPIVFLHGLGIGLLPYMLFLQKMVKDQPKDGEKDDGTVGIFLIENLPISGRMTPAVMRPIEICSEIQQILAHHGIEEFTLASHSYGSALTTYLLKYHSISCNISSVVLMDPVTILLIFPDVAYNFTRRPPKLANEHELSFAGKDADIAHTLGRHFFWSENLIWKEDLLYRPGKFQGDPPQVRNVTVMVGGRDIIINAPNVMEYLSTPSFPNPDSSSGSQWFGTIAANPTIRTSWNSPDGLMRLVYFGDLDHGQMFTTPSVNPVLMREIWGQSNGQTGPIVSQT